MQRYPPPNLSLQLSRIRQYQSFLPQARLIDLVFEFEYLVDGPFFLRHYQLVLCMILLFSGFKNKGEILLKVVMSVLINGSFLSLADCCVLQRYLCLQMSFLSGRKFLIVGGNGFVGNRIAATLVRNGGQVSVLSRSGSKFKYPENEKINWIKGDIMQAENHHKEINDADVLVHSMAALIDTVVKRKGQPGDPGSYEQMNRDSYLKMKSVIESPKKIFYISAVGHPPFIPRYETTKKQVEADLLASEHDGYIIRPGFIYDKDLKKWSIPLKKSIEFWNSVYPGFHLFTPKNTFLQRFLQEFKQSPPTELDHIAEAIAYLSQTQNPDNARIFQNRHLLALHEKYQKLAAKQ